MATLQTFLGWCALINFALLTIWFLLFVGAKQWMYRLHGRWFNISKERFDAIHYGGMAGYKLAIWLFYLAPYIALRLME